MHQVASVTYFTVYFTDRDCGYQMGLEVLTFGLCLIIHTYFVSAFTLQKLRFVSLLLYVE